MKARNLKEDLKTLLDYLWQDEYRHYQESSNKKHIFVVMKRLAKEVGMERARLCQVPNGDR